MVNIRNIFKPYKFPGNQIVFHDYEAVYFAIPKVANTSLKAFSQQVLRDHVPEQYFDGSGRPNVF